MSCFKKMLLGMINLICAFVLKGTVVVLLMNIFRVRRLNTRPPMVFSSPRHSIKRADNPLFCGAKVYKICELYNGTLQARDNRLPPVTPTKGVPATSSRVIHGRY